MSESRKSHHSADGGQAKEDDHVASYKQISQVDAELRTSKPSLSKSKEKVTDEAEEKLLDKEKEAKITTRVDMADAKYVVGDHRNGDAKIELDANKRQFSGLTKEELLKYAEDPFWVRLRWAMFALFWALWLVMLAAAIAIIVSAPKCAAPQPRTWYEEGPLVDLSPPDAPAADFTQLEADLPVLERSSVKGVFVKPCEDSYEPLEAGPGVGCLEKFRAFAAEAKKRSIKVIVDLTANFVSTTHAWFKLSENRSGEYESYFVWAASKEFDGDKPKLPNNWISVYDTPAWSWSEARRQYYLRQYAEGTADLNMENPAVVAHFDQVLEKFMSAGAAGVRLQKARTLFVNPLLPSEPLALSGAALSGAATAGQYGGLRHRDTADRPPLDALVAHWGHRVGVNATEPTVFTLAEDGRLPVEWHRLRRNVTSLRPPSLAPLTVRGGGNMTALADTITKKIAGWPALQLVSPGGEVDVATLSLLLPAAPVLAREQIFTEDVNDTSSYLSALSALRTDASVQHGQYAVRAVPASADGADGAGGAGGADGGPAALIAVARWKSGHTGYVTVLNVGGSSARGNLTAAGFPAVPAEIAVHHVSAAVAHETNYTVNFSVRSASVLVPPRAAALFSFVPNSAADE